MDRPRLIGIAVFSMLVLVVVLQNTDPVETRFLLFSFTVPRALLLFGTTLIGFVLGVLTSLRLGTKERKGTGRGTGVRGKA